jgi:hypothetical protein
MPRLVARDYSALAAQLVRRACGEHLAYTGPHAAIYAAYAARMDESAVRAQARLLLERRNRLAEHIRAVIDCPPMFERHWYFRRLCAGLALSPAEACDELRQMLAFERAKCRNRHWSARPRLVAEVHEALVFARYFRRHAGLLEDPWSLRERLEDSLAEVV